MPALPLILCFDFDFNAYKITLKRIYSFFNGFNFENQFVNTKLASILPVRPVVIAIHSCFINCWKLFGKINKITNVIDFFQ